MDPIDLGATQDRVAKFASYLDDVCSKLELEYASYATIGPFVGVVQGVVNYPEEWKKFYLRKGFHRVDPTLKTAVRSIAPVDWRRFEKDDRFRQVFGAASEFGIASQGLSIPIRGPYGECGILGVTRKATDREWELLISKIATDLQMAAVHLHDAVMSTNATLSVLGRPALSQREREILQWTAAGKSQADIGDILSISYRTVEVHLRSAREKLGALSTPQAVGRAVSMGMVQPG